MARDHFTLRIGSDNYVRVRKLNDDDVASVPPDLPDDEPPPAPVSDADVRLTIYDADGVPIVGYSNVLLAPYGDPAFASCKATLANVQLSVGHYPGEIVATRLDGRTTKRPALVSVSDD